MKIVAAEVFVTCPGRNFVTLKVTTDDGIVGLGDATLNGRELSVASYLRDHLCPQLIGRDAHRIEDIWQFFYKGAYWRRGPVTMSAISAIDMALWDIKAKAAGMPLYQLLGGASREGVMVYCHTTGHSIDEVLDDYARHKEMGFKAIRVQCGVPGMKTTYGMAKGKGQAYEPATKGQWPEEQLWSTEKYLDFTPQLFAAVREKFGFNEHLLHDMHHRLTPIEAARFGKSIEDYRLFWMEDPTPAENQECFRLIRQHTVTPIAVGEVFNSIWDCKQLIEEQLIDYIRTTITHAGGITGCVGSPILPRFIRYAPARTGRPICLQSAWRPRCISTCGCRILASRNIWAIPNRCWKSSRTAGRLITAICIRGKSRGWASSLMKNWPRNIPMNRPICRSRVWKTVRCGTGKKGSQNEKYCDSSAQ
ncbi:Starvation sensing protein RspA [Klebsiella grimontii]|nr:Starvation sensing protein RspA [Klebsiella grimontii]